MSDTGANGAAPVTSQQQSPARLEGIDYLLAALTFPLLVFVLMFATTSMTEMLGRKRARRIFGLSLLAIEAAAVAVIVLLVT